MSNFLNVVWDVNMWGVCRHTHVESVKSCKRFKQLMAQWINSCSSRNILSCSFFLIPHTFQIIPFTKKRNGNDCSALLSAVVICQPAHSSSFYTVKLDFYITWLASSARFISCYVAQAKKNPVPLYVWNRPWQIETKVLFSVSLFLSSHLHLQRSCTTAFHLWWMLGARIWSSRMWSELWLNG